MFDVGTKLVCINDKFDKEMLPHMVSFPSNGSIYTVRDVVPAIDWDMGNTCAILLEELINPPNPYGVENGFDSSRFRELEDISVEQSELMEATHE